jgi:replication-associated recombination protein RarA
MPERSGPPPTVHGHDLLDVASALQKACRRGDEELAVRAVVELDLSNFTAYAWMRLMVIASEDIGIAEPGIIGEVNALHDVWTKQAKRKNAHKPERLQLVHAALLLARAHKSRVVDHATGWAYAEDRPLELAEWVFDKHTSEGRRQGRSWEHFWNEASLLVNIDTGELTHAPIPDRYRDRAVAATSGVPAPDQNVTRQLPLEEE